MNKKINAICMILLFFFMVCAVSAADTGNETDNSTYPTALSVSSEKSIVKTTTKEKVSLKTSNMTMYYKDGSKFTATLKDKDNKAISNVKIKFTVKGQSYTKTTDSKGSVSLDLNFNSGSYVILSVFNGTSKYQSASTKNTVQIKSTIKCSDFKKVYKSTSKYSATFYDKKGTVLNNVTVKMKINDKSYSVKTTKKGVAKLDINLKQGTYNITLTNSKTLESITKTVTVKPMITSNKDVTKYYKNSKEYKVKIIQSNGKSAGSGKQVTFTVNGNKYVKTTDSDGYAKINVNLKPGTYTIKATYNNCTVSNKIIIKSPIDSDDFIAFNTGKNKYSAKLINSQGKAASGEKAVVKLNGKTYTLTANTKGVISIDLNLTSGAYNITISYNGLSKTNQIFILSTSQKSSLINLLFGKKVIV